jgi:hypothetical protein
MGLLANLPGPVRFFLVTGGSLLSLFSGRLPGVLQDAGLLTGLVLVLFGLIGSAQHYIQERRASQKPSSEHDLRNLGLAPSATSTSRRTVTHQNLNVSNAPVARWLSARKQTPRNSGGLPGRNCEGPR